MSPARLAPLLLALVVASGCRGGSRVLAPTIPPQYARVAEQGERELQCGRVEQALLVLPGVIQVRGCGERREYAISGRGRRLRVAAIVPVERSATTELSCAPDAIHVDSPAPAVRAVTGCGRRARYDLLCQDEHCAWTMTAHEGAWAGLDDAPVPDVAAVPEAPPPEPTWTPLGPDDPFAGVAIPPPPDAPPTSLPTLEDAPALDVPPPPAP